MQTKERNINLNELFFPILKQDIFTKPEHSDKFYKIPGKVALINAISKQPISVVSNDYEIFHNKDAYEYGIQCLKILFKLNSKDKIEIFNIIRPETLSYCHMDLICPDKIFDYEQDKYFPFVRITNSYNKLYKLYFRIGVCRFICENGMIFGADSIKFSYNHVKGSKELIQFDIKENSMDSILNKFKSNLQILCQSKFNFDYTFPMIYKFIGITPGCKIKTEKQYKILCNLNDKIEDLTKQYMKSLGDSFNTIYNVITDISSTGVKDENLLITKIHNRQTRAGFWLDQITELLRSKKFDYKEYLKEYLEISKN